MAYESAETGTYEAYVREFLGSGGRSQVSVGGGLRPNWRRDGKELFYVSGGKLMAVEVKASGSAATVQLLSTETVFTITDRDITNDTCICR